MGDLALRNQELGSLITEDEGPVNTQATRQPPQEPSVDDGSLSILYLYICIFSLFHGGKKLSKKKREEYLQSTLEKRKGLTVLSPLFHHQFARFVFPALSHHPAMREDDFHN